MPWPLNDCPISPSPPRGEGRLLGQTLIKGLHLEAAYSITGTPTVHLFDQESLACVGGKEAANESFVISADLLSARGQTRAVEILGDRQGEGQLLYVPFLDPQNPDSSIFQHLLEFGDKIAETRSLRDEIIVEMLSGSLAGGVENPVCRLYTVLPDEYIPKRELH
jgi:hypothetical protein